MRETNADVINPDLLAFIAADPGDGREHPPRS
jgi:hypothetical protein